MENLSTIIICGILAVICILSVISYAKKLKGGCCGGGDTEVKIKPDDTNENHYPHRSVIYIDGMICNHCKMRVENALNNLDGSYAKVNLKKQCATLLTKQNADENAIRTAIERAGYTYIKTVEEK